MKGTVLKAGTDSPKLLILIKIFAVIGVVYQLYCTTIRATNPGVIRPVHVLFLLTMAYFVAKKPGKSNGVKGFWWVIDTVLLLSVLGSTIYVIADQTAWMRRYPISSTNWDYFFAAMTLVMVLVMTQRLLGWPMVALSLVAICYCLFGHNLHGTFRILRITPRKMVTTMYYMQEGFFNSLMGICLTYVLPFVFVGKLMEICGTGDYFTLLASRLTGKSRGGPAKVAVFSSALFGTVSGAGTANVVATGTFTIPLMKKTGYPSHFAAAVEAVASTGGQIMPPVMASAAFLAADLSGIPYGTIALAALVPAIIYYASLYISIDLEAGRLQLKAMDDADIASWKEVLGGIYLLSPLAAIILVMVVLNNSPVRGAFYAMICGVVLFFINPKTRMPLWDGIKAIGEAMYKTAVSMATIGMAFLCASVVVAILNMTGIAVKLSSLILSIGQGSLLLSLLLTAVIITILGMGLPVAASYVIAASICVTPLVTLNVPLVAAHLFILHFASLSALTPPVCLSAYAAAGISGDPPMKVGFTSVRIGLVAFLLPFFFAMSPDMLIVINGAWPAIRTALTALIGCAGISFSMIGWYRKDVSWPLRAAFLIGGCMMAAPSARTDILGAVILAAALVLHLLVDKRNAAAAE